MQVQTVKSYSIELTEHEFVLLYNGLGNTSQVSRESSGMTEEQSVFFTNLYRELDDMFKAEKD